MNPKVDGWRRAIHVFVKNVMIHLKKFVGLFSLLLLPFSLKPSYWKGNGKKKKLIWSPEHLPKLLRQ